MTIVKYLDFSKDFEEIKDAVDSDWGGSVSVFLDEVMEQGKVDELAELLEGFVNKTELWIVCKTIERFESELRQRLFGSVNVVNKHKIRAN